MANSLPNRSITSLDNGYLHRAFVSVPDNLPSHYGKERVVFFEAPALKGVAAHLEALLKAAWCIDTEGWHERGYIYNCESAFDRLREEHADGELHLLATGWGGNDPEALGVESVHYAKASDVDLFVSPRVAARMHELFAQVAALRLAEPARRAAAKASSPLTV